MPFDSVLFSYIFTILNLANSYQPGRVASRTATLELLLGIFGAVSAGFTEGGPGPARQPVSREAFHFLLSLNTNVPGPIYC